MTIRVLTADDHLVVRAGLAALIATEPGLEVVGEARDGREAVERYAALRPDVVLMDLRMPGMDGVAATQAIRRDDPQARVVVITMYEGDVDIHRALAAGAIGYLLEDVPDRMRPAARSGVPRPGSRSSPRAPRGRAVPAPGRPALAASRNVAGAGGTAVRHSGVVAPRRPRPRATGDP